MPEQFTQGPSILQSDIVNNLTTDSSTKPLSAAQGKALKDAADTMNSDLTKSIKSVCPIAEGNTHSAFVAGMVIYIRNHPTLTEGSYTVTQYVAKDATLSDSNVTYNYYGGLDVLNTKIDALDSTALKFIMQTRSQIGQYTAQLKLGSQYLVVADRYSVTESNYACMYYIDVYQGDKHATRLTSNTGVLSNISISSDAVLSYTTGITYVRIIIIEISHSN